MGDATRVEFLSSRSRVEFLSSRSRVDEKTLLTPG